MSDISSGRTHASDSSLPERVAALEERTRPKPQTWLDQVKAWGGVATLVVALLYSFPLGVWDRFVVSSKQRSSAELSSVRDAIIDIADYQLEAARTIQTVTDPDMRAMAKDALGAKLEIMIQRNHEKMKARALDLTAAELSFVGFIYDFIGRFEDAIDYYRPALARVTEPIDKAQIQRLIGHALFTKPTDKDLTAARRAMESAAQELELAPDSVQRSVEQMGLFTQWARLEAEFGDPACAQEVAYRGLDRMATYRGLPDPILSDQQTWLMGIANTPPPMSEPSKGEPPPDCW